MDFEDLQALLWVHEHGSLQSASRATGVSRTTLRRRLEHLEAVAGQTIYRSAPDGVTLTSVGQTLLDEGAQLLAARSRLVARLRGPERRDTLRVLLQAGLPPAAVAIGTRLFTTLLPDVRVALDLQVDPGSCLVDPFDAVLHWGDSPILSAGYTRSLMRVTFGVMASPGYLAAHGAPETLTDLADHRLLHLQGTQPRWPCVDGEFVDITPAHTCSDLYMLGLLAGQGLGLALMPIKGPMVDAGLSPLVPEPAALIHPSIDALQRVLTKHIGLERSFRLDMPEPSSADSAAAMLIQVVESFGQPLEAIKSPGEPRQ